MYCVECGNEYGGAVQYCPEDGFSLRKHTNFSAVAELAKHCRSCGDAVTGGANYCGSCGTSSAAPAIKLAKSRPAAQGRSVGSAYEEDTIAAFTNKNAWIDKVKPGAMLAGISLVLAFAVSFIVKLVLENLIRSAAAGTEAAIFMEMMNVSVVKVLLALHMVFPSISAGAPEAFGFGMDFSLKFGLFFLPLLLGIAFALGGYLFAKYLGTSNHLTMLQTAVAGGLMYAIVVSVFALFSRESSGFGGMGGMGMDIPEISASVSYPFFTVLFFSFLLFTIFTYAGSLGALLPSKVSSPQLPEFQAVHWGLGAFAVNYLILTVIGYIYVRNTSFTKSLLFEEPESATLINFLSMQFGAYFTSIAHFGALNFQLNLPDFLYGIVGPELSELPVNGSLWLFASSGGPLFDEFFFTGFPFLLSLSFLVPVAVIAFFAYKFRSAVSMSDNKLILIFSSAYALSAAISTLFSRFVLDGGTGALGMQAGGSFVIATPMIQTFIGAFVIAALTLFITLKFFTGNKQQTAF
ncbi:zinc ribbon domain-containing protein [Alkalicoccus daliensis]|uniref:Uncharacterized protein n=1 Tax=Alkalicoccus daliensis TaxID=745820 RepID=A0A1H0GBQ1_9BACI|nr:zinc ribbon domain-containing protein [Alkalicoccus daliensis]SDO04199.1 hypothetical protein SAMN04488053_10645 [Alkalicoccus daliensis]